MVVSMTDKYVTKLGDFVREWNNLDLIKIWLSFEKCRQWKNRGNSCETARTTAVYRHTIQARRDGWWAPIRARKQAKPVLPWTL